jgi:diguanylate cyclase (GGDEF)-like protein
MTRRASWAWAITTFLAVALLGTALIKAGAERRVVVFILAVVAALAVLEACQRIAQLTREVACLDEKLNSSGRLLIEEREHRDELEKQFSHAGFQDALTGLPNRRFFIKQLGNSLYLTRLRQRNSTAVLAVELDRFKTINDSLGHAAGDELLIQAAQRFAGCMKPAEFVVARLRGSEFAMLLGGIVDQGAALKTAKSLQRTLADPFHIRGQTVFTGATIGVTLSRTGFEQPEELLRSADVALSRARSEGQGRIVLVDAAALDQASSLQQLETDLHRAIERSEFRLQFQPIVDLESGGLVGMETLVRWHHPLEGLIMPGRFIALAESTGLIVPITRQLLRAACLQARAWRERLPADVSFYISVNMSTQDLRETDVCDFVAGAIAEAGLPPGLLRLEVTEGIMIEDLRATRELLARFGQLGIPLLLDDFGTGYSSLSYLSRLPFDYLKIDRAFVNRLSPDEQDPGIVRAIVQMAKSLGMKTIAEGVETPHHWTQLKALGCDLGQGYYFSKPLDAGAMEEMLVSRRKWPVYAADPRPNRLLKNSIYDAR